MKSKKPSKSTLKRILKMLSGYKLLLALTVILALAYVVLYLMIPVLAGRTVDSIVGAGNVNFDSVKTYLIEILIFVLLAAASQWLMSIINNAITYNVIRDMRKSAFVKLLKVPIKYIDANSQGEIVSKVITDVDTFADGLLIGFTQLFTGIATIIGTLIFMAVMSPLITAVVVVLTPISLFAARFIAKHTHDMFTLQSERRGNQTAFTDEMISNQKVVKAFSYEERSEKRFDEINDSLKSASLRATFFSSLTNPVTRFVNSIVYLFVAFLGAFSVISGGGFTVGMLVSFLSYANQYTKPFNEISGVITELQNAIACAERVFLLLDESDESDSNGELSEKTDGKVDFNSIYFSYSPEKPLIENFSFNIEPGKKIAIVGPTGCGKTTVINLLMRFYDVSEGAILIDGRNISEIKRSEVRSAFGMVLQETWLKSGTIKDNLKMGVPNATDEQITEAAKATRADSFIKRLSDGYNTVIGENGGSLSEGQKQLLCITRVMLMNPPMLILDEATSSVDTRTEMKIQRAFDALMKGKTTFIVAHRLSTIKNADSIIVMKDGKILETGNHNELMEKNGFYYNLYNSGFNVST